MSEQELKVVACNNNNPNQPWAVYAHMQQQDCLVSILSTALQQGDLFLLVSRVGNHGSRIAVCGHITHVPASLHAFRGAGMDLNLLLAVSKSVHRLNVFCSAYMDQHILAARAMQIQQTQIASQNGPVLPPSTAHVHVYPELRHRAKEAAARKAQSMPLTICS